MEALDGGNGHPDDDDHHRELRTEEWGLGLRGRDRRKGRQLRDQDEDGPRGVGPPPRTREVFPVALVSAVVARTTAVQVSSRLPVSKPNTTSSPAPMPMRLNTT
jgi:hypothetical protein